MNQARNRNLRRVKKEKKNHLFLKIFVPSVVILLFLGLLKINTRVWNGRDKVSLVYRQEDSIFVTVLDPVILESATFIIPGDTEVDVARNYGTFRIKNVWQLGINERIDGKLLAETVTQNFLFPTFLWVDKSPGLDTGSINGIIKFMFFPGTTNIAWGDRIRIGLFSLKVRDFDKTVIDLAKSQYLVKKRLNDGETGYVLTGSVSERLTSYFSDNEIGSQGPKVSIIDSTGAAGVAEKMGEILQVMGGKVVSIEKNAYQENTDCLVSGKSASAVKKAATLFFCTVENEESLFDLNIKIGGLFAKRF